MINGYIFGPILVISGAYMSYYTAMMIIKCSLKTNKKRYEDIALSLYGAKVGRATSIINIICLLSFDFAYISYYKSVIP